MEQAAVFRAVLARSHPAHCPPWCSDCEHHDYDPPGAVLHRSPPVTVAVYDEDCKLVDAHVRAAFWDKPPQWIGTDPTDLERPHVEVCVTSGADERLYADTEASYRPLPSTRVVSAAAPGSAPPVQA